MMSRNVKLVNVKLALIMKKHLEKLLLNSLYFITYLLLHHGEFIYKEFFNINVGYSICTSHYLPPYFVTKLFNKFVAVSD